MKRLLRCLPILLLVAASPPPAPAPGPDPQWLAGAWSETRSAEWHEEFWSPMRGGVMLGAARSGSGDKALFWEQTRILRTPDGKLVFWASPRGAAASSFPLVAQSPTMIEFANAAHDYPQRIRYWREGTPLRARISLMDGSRAQEWTYAPMGGDGDMDAADPESATKLAPPTNTL